jgi:hypothetical protein
MTGERRTDRAFDAGMMGQVSTPPQRKIIEALHPSRMGPYLDVAHHNEKNAVRLYRWHIELTAAVQAVLGVTEVILRNAMDRQLQAWNDIQTGGTDSWLLTEPAAPLRSLSSDKRREAKRLAAKQAAARPDDHSRHGAPVTHDDVLAHIMFGLWKDLLPNHSPGAGNTTENANRERLWCEALKNAFPNQTDPDGAVTYWRVSHLHLLRNRASHMEPLLDRRVKDRIDDAFKLITSIDPDVANWVTGTSQVATVLRQRPEL